MAIPTYKREQLNAQTAVEQHAGAADAAAATGYGQIAGQQKQLSNVQGQTTNIEMRSLSQRLGEFDAYMNTLMVADASQRAKEAGVIDTAKRRAEIMEIRQKYANDPVKADEEIAKVTTATASDNFSVYGGIYQSTRDAAYANQAEIDAHNADQYAQSISNGNPEKYKEAYKAYEREVVKGAPNDVGVVAAHKAFEKRGTTTYETMYRKNTSKSTSEMKQLTNDSTESLIKLIEDAAGKGQVANVAALQGQLAAQTKAAVAQGLMSPATAEWLNKDAYNKAQVQSFLLSANANIDDGMGYEMLMKMGNPTHPYGKAFNALTPEAQKEVTSTIKSRIETRNAATTGKLEAEAKFVKAQSFQNLQNYKLNIVESGKKLTGDEIQKLEASGNLTKPDADDLRSFNNQTTDDEIMVYYASPKNLLSTTPEAIMGLDGISTEDRKKLLTQHAQLSKQYQWTSSQNGREAVRRVDALFGILPDQLIAGFGKDDPKAKAHNQMRSELFNQIAGLPPEKQAEKAVEIANQLIAQYGTDREELATTKQQQSDEKIYNDAANKAAEYNEEYLIIPNTIIPKTKRSVEQQLALPPFNKSKADIQRIIGGRSTPKPASQPPKPAPRKTKPKLTPLTVYTPASAGANGTRPSTGYNSLNKQPAKNLPVVSHGTTNRYTGRSGGSKSWRNNNPFNISASGNNAHIKGAVGRASSEYGDVGDQNMIVFSDYEAGQQAFIDLIYRAYDDAPIAQTFSKYQSDQVNFANKLKVLRAAGVPTNVKFSQLDATQQIDFLKVWRKFEGYTVGRSL